MRDKSTYWMSHPSLPGYEHRLNEEGYRETRPKVIPTEDEPMLMPLPRQDWDIASRFQVPWSGREMLERIRQSLQARLEGRNEGGDIEVMRLVDEIVKNESILHLPGLF